MKIKPTELTKLRKYFDTNGIIYEVAYWEENRYNLHVDLEYAKLSFLTSEGSYGGYNGLIEFYNFSFNSTSVFKYAEAGSNDLADSETLTISNISSARSIPFWINSLILRFTLSSSWLYSSDLSSSIAFSFIF